MMGRIEAQERLVRIGDGFHAAGLLSAIDQGMRSRRLEEAASGTRMPVAKATPAVLTGMGIGVRIVSPASEGAPSDV